MDLARRLKVPGAVDLEDQGSLAGELRGHFGFQLSQPVVPGEEEDHLAGLPLGMNDGDRAEAPELNRRRRLGGARRQAGDEKEEEEVVGVPACHRVTSFDSGAICVQGANQGSSPGKYAPV